MGAMNSDFVPKAGRRRRYWTNVPENHVPQVRIQAAFVLKEEPVWLAAVNFLVLESLVLADLQEGQVTVFL